MTTFSSHQLPVLIIPRLSHPSICTPTHRIKNHHRHHTWRLPYSLPHLLSNTQDQTRRHYLLHTPTNAQRQTTNAQRQTHSPLTILVPIKMPRGQTAHLLNHRKPTAMAAKQAIHAPPHRPHINKRPPTDHCTTLHSPLPPNHTLPTHPGAHLSHPPPHNHTPPIKEQFNVSQILLSTLC